jgi:uncharacterized RmlC-like cupin family protein
MLEAILKQFESPDEIRTFEKGKFEVVNLGVMSIGRATYQPGWKWSKHVGPTVGATLCDVEHVGMVVSGHAVALMPDNVELQLIAGTLFYIPALPHDSWVVGNEPYVSLHFLGTQQYAK